MFIRKTKMDIMEEADKNGNKMISIVTNYRNFTVNFETVLKRLRDFLPEMSIEEFLKKANS